MSRRVDLAIIGSGPGGHAAAMAASRRGLKVALIEREAWGGVCLNIGCIPTKALVAVAKTMRRFRQAEAMGLRVQGLQLDYPAAAARNERIVTSLRQGVVGLLRRAGVALLSGEAAFDDPHTLTVRAPVCRAGHGTGRDGRAEVLSADRAIIATGASPHPGPWGFDGVQRLSYRDLLRLTSLPSSLLIIGGGAIGCEFASCFAGFGVPVTLVEQEPQILPGEDPEAVRVLAANLQARGVAVASGTTVRELTTTSTGVRALLANGSTVAAERCLIAVGLRPNTAGLGLDRIGIGAERGVEVDAHLLTRHRHIAAIGDCLAGHGLANVASAEGLLAVRNLCGGPLASLDPDLIPRCVFTDPELAQVGRLESQVEADAKVSRLSFAALGKSVCDEDPEGFVKLIVEAASQRVLGATIVGAHASDLIHLVVVAIRHGLTAKHLAETLTAHPTLPEGVTEAAAQIYGEALYSAQKARSVPPTAAPTHRLE